MIDDRDGRLVYYDLSTPLSNFVADAVKTWSEFGPCSPGWWTCWTGGRWSRLVPLRPNWQAGLMFPDAEVWDAD